MVGQFKNNVVLVDRRSSGIGRASALAFAKEGATVTIADLVVEGGKETESIIRESGGTAIFTEVDVSKASEVEAMINTVVGPMADWTTPTITPDLGKVGRLLPSARKKTGKRHQHEPQRGLVVYEIRNSQDSRGRHCQHLIGFRIKRGSELARLHREQTWGHRSNKSRCSRICTSGIRINAVCPDAIRTPMQERLMGVPFGRPPEEVAQAVVWLCSDASSATTGETLTYRKWKRRMPRANSTSNVSRIRLCGVRYTRHRVKNCVVSWKKLGII